MTSSLQHLSRRDIERLSAYLDGELSSGDRQTLEARLEKEAKLSAGLEELRATVNLLRTLPSVRAPRSYRLTVEMVRGQRRTWGYPTLQLATAVAALAFLVVVGFDAVINRAGRSALQAPQFAAPSVQEEAASEALKSEGALTEDELAPLEEAPAEAPVAGAADRAAEEEEPLVQGTPGAMMEFESAGEAEAPEPAEERAGATATVAPTSPPTSTSEPTLLPTASPTSTPQLTPPVVGRELEEVRPGMVPRALLRVAEFGLAALVVALLVMTLRMRSPRS